MDWWASKKTGEAYLNKFCFKIFGIIFVPIRLYLEGMLPLKNFSRVQEYRMVELSKH